MRRLAAFILAIGVWQGRTAAAGNDRHEERILADVREAESLGLHGAPAVFINGRAIRGVHSWETYRQIAAAELAKKKQAARRRNARR